MLYSIAEYSPYSPVILNVILSLILDLDSVPTSDWLNHSALPITNCVTFKFGRFLEKGLRLFLRKELRANCVQCSIGNGIITK